MRARRWLALIPLFAAGSVLIWYFLVRSDPLAEEVDRLLEAIPIGKATIDDLWALGPRVVPHLARNARQRDSIVTKAYGFIWSKLPNRVRARLKRPQSRAYIRAAALSAITTLGPLAAYGAEQAVIEALSDPLRTKVYALHAIEWLVPERPAALNAYEQLLADTNQVLLEGSRRPRLKTTSDRQAHRSITTARWRRRPSEGSESPPQKSSRRSHSVGTIRTRRCAPLQRPPLGNCHQTLAVSLTISSPALMITTFVPCPESLTPSPRSVPLPALRSNRLRKFTDSSFVRQWVTEPDQHLNPLQVHDIVMAATMATCRLEPARCIALMPQLATQVGQSPTVCEFLRDLRACSNDVINALGPLLGATNGPWRSSWAAYVILAHNRDHAEALAVLRRNKTQGAANERMLAAERLFDVNGDTNGVWQLIEEGSPLDQPWGNGRSVLSASRDPRPYRSCAVPCGTRTHSSMPPPPRRFSALSRLLR